MAESLIELLVETSSKLKEEGISFALMGGLAANLYRTSPRPTADVDCAILCDGNSVTKGIAVIEALGFKATPLTKAELDGGPQHAIKQKSTPTLAIIGRYPNVPDSLGLDFLLPEIPWVPDAVKRAQSNLHSIGPSKKIPVLTPEDLILSKLLSYNARKERVKDLDDLKTILEAKLELDVDFLAAQIRLFKTPIPKLLHPLCHFKLLRAHRSLKRVPER